MAAELSFRHTATGATVKATIRKPLTVGGKIQMWRAGTVNDWENLTVDSWSEYALPMTETPTSSYGYVGTWPAAMTTPGWYVVDFYDGATIAGILSGSFLGYWDGTTFNLAGTDARQINASAQAAANVASAFLGTGDVDDVDFVVRNFHAFSDTDHAVRMETTCAGKDGMHTVGVVYGQYNYGGEIGQDNSGENFGQYNEGGVVGQNNLGTASYGQCNAGGFADIWLDGTGTIDNNAGNVVQLGSAAALAAYNTTGVAKEASVGAIATIFTGITSLAAWLRGLFRKDTINATALSEINAIHDGGAAGTYSATTDSNEAIRDAVDAVQAGSGLTAQQTRDAMKLAPASGTPATGSVDAELDAIKLKTDTIGSGRVTYASTVAEAALGTIWAGDDYRAADGTQFSITVEDYAGPSLATATAVLRIMDSVQYLSEDEDESVEADLEVAATITIDGDTITLAADLTAAQTAALDTSPPAAPRNYIYEFVCTLANTHVGYRTHGQLTVKKAIAGT